MKNGNSIYFAIASAGFISLLSFSAIADSSTPQTLEKMIQVNAEKQLAAEGNKYNRIVSLAGNRQNELAEKKNEVASTYQNWHDLKSGVASHYPNSNDFTVVEMAAKAYSMAHKAFVELQKNILAQKEGSLDPVTINSLIATSPTATGMK